MNLGFLKEKTELSEFTNIYFCFISKSSQVLIRSRILRENGKYIPKQVGSFINHLKLMHKLLSYYLHKTAVVSINLSEQQCADNFSFL